MSEDRLMKYLLLILAIPFFTAQAAAPECEELKKWTKDLELKMQESRIGKSCTELKLETDVSSENKKDFEDYRCRDFSAIELKLKSVESEIAMYRGLSSLKAEIQRAKESLKRNGDRSLVEANTKSFFRNLKFAADLELFLGANNSKKENILSALAKAPPADLESPEAFGRLIVEKCKEFNASQASVCNKQFAVTEDFRADFLDLVRLGKNTEPKFDKAQVNRLKDALVLKNGKVDYTYGQLLGEMKNSDAAMITAEDLAKLKSLPEFSNSKKFDFISKLKNAKRNLGNSQTLIEAQGAPAKFAGFLSALKNREEWELKSKLFLVLKQVEGNTSETAKQAKQACDNSQALAPEIENCFKALMDIKELESSQRNAIKDLKDEFVYGQNQVKNLDDLISSCIPDQDLNFADEQKCEGVVSNRMIELEQKASILSNLKLKVAAAAPQIMIFRNYAIEKLMANECLKPEETNIPNCYENIGTISREAVALTDSVNKVIYVYDKPAQATQVDQLCKQEHKGTPEAPVEHVPYKQDLCRWKIKDTTQKANSIQKELYDAPVSPEKQRPSTLQNLTTLGKNLLNTFMPARPPQAAFNPYPSPSPYALNYPGLLHPYQQVMVPAVQTGFGNYQNLTGSSGAYAFGGSSHFNAPFGRNLI